MASTLAHTASASLVALTFAHARPDETSYVVAALISAAILDLDHLYYVIRDREMYRQIGFQGQLHHARSAFHELFGLLLVGVLSGGLFWVEPKLARIVFVAFTIHLAQDWVLGKAAPLTPIDPTVTQFFALTFKQKALMDVVLVITFGGLWILYLIGAV
jgi:hypothetical protein